MLVNILMAFAFVFLCCAAIGVPSLPRISFGWLGMAFWAFAQFILPLI